jgi:hypothetical protein
LALSLAPSLISSFSLSGWRSCPSTKNACLVNVRH